MLASLLDIKITTGFKGEHNGVWVCRRAPTWSCGLWPEQARARRGSLEQDYTPKCNSDDNSKDFKKWAPQVPIRPGGVLCYLHIQS